MKTTIELSDVLFKSAKELAAKRQVTMRSLVEDGLRRVLFDEPKTTKQAFKLKDARVKGKALLIEDPRQWSQLEQDHVVAGILKP